MKGVNHYLKDGTKWSKSMHKMPNGQLHSGKTSKRLFHYSELSDKAKKESRKRS